MSNKKTMKSAVDALKTPCTITEAVQIARGVAEDAIADYHHNQGNVQLAMSIQVEILKEVVFKSGMMTEEEFKTLYLEKAREIQKIQKERMNLGEESEEPTATADMKVEAGDVEVRVEK